METQGAIDFLIPKWEGAWTEELCNYIKTQAAAQQSSGWIADQLGAGVTRNMVISKAVRLGVAFSSLSKYTPADPHRKRGCMSVDQILALRKERSEKRREQARIVAERRKAQEQEQEQEQERALAYAEPPLAPEIPWCGAALPTEKHMAGMCSFPIGDPQDASFAWCAAPREKRSYCAAHYALCYQPPAARVRHAQLRRL